MTKTTPFRILWAFVIALTLAISPKAFAASPKNASTVGNPKNFPTKAAPAAVKNRSLDTLSVHKQYLDGDFDMAIEGLESALKTGGPFTHGDSVFIFKHLGVMYTAKYETREKGKQYMLRLLEVEPTAKIMDMYASDMIYMIFKNIQEEYETSRAKLTHADKNLHGNTPDTLPGASNRPQGDPKVSESHAWLWVGASAAMVTAGVAAYFVLNSSPTTKHVDASF